jgi:hypothetical protein
MIWNVIYTLYFVLINDPFWAIFGWLDNFINTCWFFHIYKQIHIINKYRDATKPYDCHHTIISCSVCNHVWSHTYETVYLEETEEVD